MLAAAWATVAAAAPIAFPPLTGRVVDAAHVLPPATVAALTDKLKTLEDTTGTQLVVATIPALNDVPISDYGVALGRAWQIGQKGKNSGAILLVAPNDRKVWITVGYGLEPILTDALSEEITQEAILPAFRKGDFAGGVTAGTDALIAQLSASPDAAAATASQATVQHAQARHRPSAGPGALFWLAIVVVWVIFSAMRRGGGYGAYGGRSSGLGSALLWGAASSMLSGGRGGGFGGGGFGGGDSDSGGGGFSGGGGSFGGGGAGGSW